MTRDERRRTSRASARRSYTSFFATSRGAGEGSSRSTADSLSPPPSPPPRTPTSGSTRDPRASQSTSNSRPRLTAKPTANAKSNSNKRKKSKAIARPVDARIPIEQRLENLYQSVPGPVHSLKAVDPRARDQVEAELYETGNRIGLRNWWNARQWQDRRQPNKLEPDSSTKSADDEVQPSPVVARPTLMKRSKKSKLANHAAAEAEPELVHPSVSFDLAESTKPELPLTVDAPMPYVMHTIQTSASPLLAPPVHAYLSTESLYAPPLCLAEPEPTTYSDRTPSNAYWPEPDEQPSYELKNQTDQTWTVPTTPACVQVDTSVVEFPAQTLVIGPWARRAAVDPSQLSVAYLAATDSIVLSTQHLESIYHIHLPVESVSSLVLFHSLAYSSSILLVDRDLSSPFQPNFSVTTPTAAAAEISLHHRDTALSRDNHHYHYHLSSSSSSSSQVIGDFTPGTIASTTGVYALELAATSTVPNLIEEIDVVRLERLGQHRFGRDETLKLPPLVPALARRPRALLAETKLIERLFVGPLTKGGGTTRRARAVVEPGDDRTEVNADNNNDDDDPRSRIDELALFAAKAEAEAKSSETSTSFGPGPVQQHDDDELFSKTSMTTGDGDGDGVETVRFRYRGLGGSRGGGVGKQQDDDEMIYDLWARKW